MVSTEGGMEIEKVAAEAPEKIIKEAVDPRVGFQAFQARRLAFGLGLKGDQHKAAVKTFLALAKA
jgi:succinyl-CoA synthetase beta subunit